MLIWLQAWNEFWVCGALGGGRGEGLLSNPFLQVTLLFLALDIPQGLPGRGARRRAPLSGAGAAGAAGRGLPWHPQTRTPKGGSSQGMPSHPKGGQLPPRSGLSITVRSRGCRANASSPSRGWAAPAAPGSTSPLLGQGLLPAQGS